MKKLLRLDSIDAGGRAKQEVHDILASRCIVSPHSDLPAAQAEELATQVSLGQETVSCPVPLAPPHMSPPPLPQQPELHLTFSCGLLLHPSTPSHQPKLYHTLSMRSNLPPPTPNLPVAQAGHLVTQTHPCCSTSKSPLSSLFLPAITPST